MPFIDKLLNYKSVSFVGMEKNAGKTQTLNYVLGRLRNFSDLKIAVSSIGIDGEQTDQVTKTAKPQIRIYPGTVFVTAEGLYPQREIVSCIEEVSKQTTALGRLITAEAVSEGKVLLAGPGNTVWLKEFTDKLEKRVDICLVDGALSRMSFGSPSITDAMILSTGAALSASLAKVVRQTKFIYDMTRLPAYSGKTAEILRTLDKGIYAIEKGKVTDLEIPSLLMIDKYRDRIFSRSNHVFVAGILNDRFMQYARTRKNAEDTIIIIKDFTRVFAKEENVRLFLERGGRIEVLDSANLIAITANPISPTGYNFDNEQMLNALREAIPADIYNIKSL